MKKIIWIIIGISLIFLCQNIFNQDQKQNPIKIGVSTVLSGDFAAAGENMVNAARLAVQEINNQGGINGRKIELYIEDAGWDSKTGLAATQKLIDVHKVKYIIGGTSSNGTLASAPIVNKKRVIYLTPVTGGSNIDEAGEYVFRIANSDLLAGRDIAQAMVDLGFKNVGVVAEVTEYTIDLKKSFEKTINELGGNIVISEEFQPGTTDFRTLITKVKEVKPQAVFIASQTGIGGAHFIKQSREIDIKTTYFSDFTFVTNTNAKDIVGSFEGIYFADPSYNEEGQKTKEFFSLYQEMYSKPSVIPFHAASTYDSVKLITEAIKNVGDDSQKVHDWLLKVNKYEGLMGTYSLDDKGNSDLGFDIKIVKNNSFEEI